MTPGYPSGRQIRLSKPESSGYAFDWGDRTLEDGRDDDVSGREDDVQQWIVSGKRR